MAILHLASLSDWEAAFASGEYRFSTRGRTLDEVGYIHASRPEQLKRVAEFVYADATTPLCVLVLDERKVAEAGIRVVEEDGGEGELYPHIYGPIRADFVVDVIPAEVDDRGTFTLARALPDSSR